MFSLFHAIFKKLALDFQKQQMHNHAETSLSIQILGKGWIWKMSYNSSYKLISWD